MKITLYQPTLSLLLLLLLSGSCAVNREKEKTTTPQASPLAEIVPWQMVERVTILKADQDPIYALAISPDNSLLLSGSFDGTVREWDLKTQKPLRTWQLGDTVNAIQFSPDGETFVTADAGGKVQRWNTRTGKLEMTYPGHAFLVTDAAISPDGEILATGSWDRTVKLWDFQTGTLLKTLRGHNHPIQAIAFSPDGKGIVSADYDGFGATLTLLTTSAQAPMVQMQLPKLRERVNACYGYAAISRISLTQTAPAGFDEGQADFGRTPPARARAADPALCREASAAVLGVQDDGLRAALESLTLNFLTRSRTSKGRT